MKKIYSTLLKKILAEKIESELVGFVQIKPKLSKEEKAKSWYTSNSEIFQNKVNSLILFLVVSPHPRLESFDLEIGWSILGSILYDRSASVGLKELNGSEFERPTAILPFGYIYNLRGKHEKAHIGWDVWVCSVGHNDPRYKETYFHEYTMPVSQEMAEHRVTQAVEKFIADVKEYALPYFDERVKRYKETGK
jgi:hypothetical protein